MRIRIARAISGLLVALAATTFIACEAPRSASSRAGDAPRPIVVQGAMEVEVRALVAGLERPAEERIQGWTFWRGTLDGYPVIVSKTLKGMSSAAAATALAVERFSPAAIINQGTAGGHDPALHVYDIVIGREAVNVGAFKTGFRPRGGGSNFAEWKPMDLLYSEGSAGQDPNAWTMHRFPADALLLRAANQASTTYAKGRVVEGVIASSDTWTSELDRIERLRDEFHTSVEEMETASAAQVAGLSQIQFLGIRVVSNNITNSQAYDGQTAPACQAFVIDVVKAYLGARASR